MAIEAAEVRDGYLLLKEDPGPWIQSHPADLLSVRILELQLSSYVEKIGDMIGDLSELTHLYFFGCNSLKCLPNTITRLAKLQVLKLDCCCDLEVLPKNLGELESLTHLSLSRCLAIKSLPNSLAKLSKLKTLKVEQCGDLEELPSNLGEFDSLTHLSLSRYKAIKPLLNNLVKLSYFTILKIENFKKQELPENLGELENLTHLCLSECIAIKSLPNSLAKLSKLKTLEVTGCYKLEELPANLNVVQLSIELCCSIQVLPKGLSNLDRLKLSLCNCSKDGLANLKYSVNLRHLTLLDCHYNGRIREFSANFDDLVKLSHVDIRKTRYKCLPWSITKLLNLQFLFLPEDFRLETLPYDLDDSVIISVENWHIRKTWKELKTEMESLLSSFREVENLEMAMITPENPSILEVSSPGYLQLEWKGGPMPWIQNNYNSLMPVKILDLKVPYYEEIEDSIWELLPELTNLYISGGGKISNLPDKIMRITHLSLDRNGIDSLEKFSNLVSLDLHLSETDFPSHIDHLVNLRCLTLRYFHGESLPDSMGKLSNLKTLVLYKCLNISLPANLNLAKLKLIDCNIESLPASLHHLEILHDCEVVEICLNQLVNLKTLSATCYSSKFLPSVAGLHNLRELQLKDCFKLIELPPNMDELVELCTLDISGTIIKSLPDSITKLHNLQSIILPKCFRQKNLSRLNIKESVKITINETDEEYYDKRGYYNRYCESSTENSDEENEITPGSAEETNEVVSEEDIIANQDLGEFHCIGRKDALNENNQNASRSSQNLAVNEFDEFHCNASKDGVNENNQNAPRSSQNVEMEIRPSPNEDRTSTSIVQGPVESHSILHDKEGFGESSQHNKNNPDTASSSGSKPAQLHFANLCNNPSSHKHAPECFNGTNDEAIQIVEDPGVGTLCKIHGREHASGTLDGANQGTQQENPSLNKYLVKATYKGDTIRLHISLTTSFYELKKEVAENLELELSKFKIKYEDEQKEEVRMTNDSHLKELLELSRSSGNNNIVRVSIHDL